MLAVSTSILVRRLVPWWRRARGAAVIGFFVLIVLADAESRTGRNVFGPMGVPIYGPVNWLPVAGGIVVAALAAYVLIRSPTPTRIAAAGLGAVATSVAVSLALALIPHEIAFSMMERLGLAVLTAVTVRRCPARQVIGVVATVAGALAGMLLPRGELGMGSLTVDAAFLVMLFVLAVVIGLYLRSLDSTRLRQIDQTRRAERLALARDLHDVVAHHVTGIVVQTQALRHVAERDPEVATQALEQIERAGSEALIAMRRVIGTLREDGSPAPREPSELRAALEQLTGQAEHPPTQLAWEGAANTAVPAEVGSAIVRVVQEALTNARRHARDATRVDVGVRIGTRHVTLDVSDDGRDGRRFRDRGGHGLVGMAERAELLGGEFTAGPREGGGWDVRATFPLTQAQQ